MRIAFMNYWFSEGLGYSENALPSAVARLGHDVHLVTSDGQIYYNSPDYARTYEPFLGPALLPTGTARVGDVTVHRLPRRSLGVLHGVRGLVSKLRQLRPDVVQGFETFDLMALQAALAQPVLRYALFLESHVHRSVFAPVTGTPAPLARVAWRGYARTLGALVGARTERCYAISRDAAEIAHEYFGMRQARLEVCPLGVDTALFRPPDAAEGGATTRAEQRRALGFAPGEIVCVYTGRFSAEKRPLLLADAVAALRREGRPYRGLFVGDGEQAAAIRERDGCLVHPFVRTRELPRFYWASDVGVWPKQESTSQLDAAACGLPVVIGDRAEVRDRVDGNGAVYREDSADDLARVLAGLADPAVRRRLGARGAAKMESAYGWDAIARRRVDDYARSRPAAASARR